MSPVSSVTWTIGAVGITMIAAALLQLYIYAWAWSWIAGCIITGPLLIAASIAMEIIADTETGKKHDNVKSNTAIRHR